MSLLRWISDRLLFSLWVLLFMGIILGLTWQGVVSFVLGVGTLTWPKVPGTVIHSSIHREERTRERPERCGVDIQYQYRWAGQTFTEGTGLGDLPETPPPEECLASAFYAKRYPVGRAVQVSVHPRHPERSTLAPGVQWFDLYPFGAAFCLGMLVFAIVHGAATQPAQLPAGEQPEARRSKSSDS